MPRAAYLSNIAEKNLIISAKDDQMEQLTRLVAGKKSHNCRERLRNLAIEEIT